MRLSLKTWFRGIAMFLVLLNILQNSLIWGPTGDKLATVFIQVLLDFLYMSIVALTFDISYLENSSGHCISIASVLCKF